jgi:hypothetical protein
MPATTMLVSALAARYARIAHINAWFPDTGHPSAHRHTDCDEGASLELVLIKGSSPIHCADRR